MNTTQFIVCVTIVTSCTTPATTGSEYVWSGEIGKENKVFKFSNTAADNLKCIGMIFQPPDVQGDGPRIFYVDCAEIVKCGYRGNPYRPSCRDVFTMNEMSYFECLAEAATEAAPTACFYKRLRCQKMCPDVYFDLWEEADGKKTFWKDGNMTTETEYRIQSH